MAIAVSIPGEDTKILSHYQTSGFVKPKKTAEGK